MELTSQHLTCSSPAFALVFAAIVLLFFPFLLSPFASFSPAALPPHVKTSPPPTAPNTLFSACPPRCVTLPSLAILCSLKSLHFSLYIFLARAKQSPGEPPAERHNIWWPSRKAPPFAETRFNRAAACHCRVAFLSACKNLFFFLGFRKPR